MTDPEATSECVKVAVRCRPMNQKELDRGKFSFNFQVDENAFQNQVENARLFELRTLNGITPFLFWAPIANQS